MYVVISNNMSHYSNKIRIILHPLNYLSDILINNPTIALYQCVHKDFESRKDSKLYFKMYRFDQNLEYASTIHYAHLNKL